MKAPFTCLSADSLRRLATNDFSPEQLRELESHVDHCPHCRELLNQEVSPLFKDSVAHLLSPSSGHSSLITGDEEKTYSPSYDSIVKMLGPTDDPHRMGRIDAYEVVGIVGRGGAGVVFKAFDPGLQRFVAIKMLLPHMAESGAARKRFAREAKAAAAVVNDYVLPIHGVSEWKGLPYIVSQFCRGETLQKRIEVHGPLQTREVLRISLQIARGLAAAHAQGLVHRDVKPANILLDQGIERVQLTDFGLARAIDDASMTRTGVVAGTPQYMSPEQAQGRSLDGRSDLFALGCVMYTLCTGRPPFRDSQLLAVLQKIATEPHKPVQTINPEIPRPLSKVIDRLLEKNPNDRIQSADELAHWLESYLAYLEQPTSQPKPRLPISNRNWKLIRLSSLVVVLLGVGLASFYYGASSWKNPNNFGRESGSPRGKGDLTVAVSDDGKVINIEQLRESARAFAVFADQMESSAAESKQLEQEIHSFQQQNSHGLSLPIQNDSLLRDIINLDCEIREFEKQISR